MEETFSPAPATAPRSPLLTPFVGPNGVRAGWRFVLFNLVIFFFGWFYSRIIHLVMQRSGHALPHEMNVKVGLFQESLLLLCLICAVSVMCRFVDRRPIRLDYLPSATMFGRNFWVGALWGISMLSLLLLAMRGMHLFYIDGVALDLKRGVGFGALWAVMFVMVGLFEESFSRGYAQRTLAQGTNFWIAASINSLLFAAMHMGNGGENVVGLLSVVAVALFFCLTLWRTGSLWFAVGLHFAWDWGQTFFYGTPDSGMVAPGHLFVSHMQGRPLLTGGADGPEGSIFVLVVLAAAAGLFAVLYPERRWTLDGGGSRPAEMISITR